jgi:dynein heavy chain
LKPIKSDKEKFLGELTNLVRKPANEVERLKLVALITIEVHARDIITQLI